MKFIKYNIGRSLLVLLLILGFSCNEKEFLEETPLGFFSPENSYQTLTNFESALTDLYARVRSIHFGGSHHNYFAHFLATDIAKHARGDANRFGDYDVWLVPTSRMVEFHWENWYKVIANANTIISRLPESHLTDQQMSTIQAEARFFRAFAYRYLVYLYGGVPLILEEVSNPKTDFARASKEEVLQQIVSDAQMAADILPDINEVTDGRVSNLVAHHLLAETYISLREFDLAIEEATLVIDDPNTALMTERFGSRINEDPYDAYLELGSGDVFWDLFQQGNQNRSSGNQEALWVAQMEIDVPGGFLQSSGGTRNNLEKWAGPVAWLTFQDPDGNEGSLTFGQSNYNSGGRGVAFMMNTDYYLYDLWEADWNQDIRNAPHNIVRDYVYTNPESAWYDSSAVTYPSPTWESQNWRWYPYPSKITTPGVHPDELFEDEENLTLKTTAGSTYRDMYYLRLAETYLLRAEAYMKQGDPVLAAEDINLVRERSKAHPIDPSEVSLDFILDERARELIYEEQRRITLHRTGMLVERVREYNDLNGDEIKDFHNLWPIPFSEIEANKDAELEQNPGYY